MTKANCNVSLPCNNVTIVSEAVTGVALQEKLFLEILQNSQENTCPRVSFLIKLQALGPQPY